MLGHSHRLDLPVMSRALQTMGTQGMYRQIMRLFWYKFIELR